MIGSLERMSFSPISFWATVARLYALPLNFARNFQPLVESGPCGCRRLRRSDEISKKRFQLPYPRTPKCAWQWLVVSGCSKLMNGQNRSQGELPKLCLTEAILGGCWHRPYWRGGGHGHGRSARWTEEQRGRAFEGSACHTSIKLRRSRRGKSTRRFERSLSWVQASLRRCWVKGRGGKGCRIGVRVLPR